MLTFEIPGDGGVVYVRFALHSTFHLRTSLSSVCACLALDVGSCFSYAAPKCFVLSWLLLMCVGDFRARALKMSDILLHVSTRVRMSEIVSSFLFAEAITVRGKVQ